MHELSHAEIESISGGLEQNIYYSMGHALGGWYSDAVDATSVGIEWVMTGGKML